MKQLAIIMIFSAFIVKGTGQKIVQKQPTGPFTFAPKGIQSPYMVNPDWQARTMEAGALWGTYNSVKGNAFYNDEWDKGYILLRDNRIAQNIFIAFNIYTNEIYYIADSQVLVLDPLIPVAEFGIHDQKEDSTKTTIFRCGYPATDNNTDKTFYKVLVDNKISLLKHYNKKIIERNNQSGVPERAFIDSESWYIFNTREKKIIPIKKNKNSLLTALSQYADKIESILKKRNLKLKTENDWIMRMNELNNQIK